MTPTFESQREAWKAVPVDHLNRYVTATELMQLSDDELRDLVQKMETERYQGWRNYNGLWRETLGLDTTVSKRVLDYGCGLGLEALQFAKAGNWVVLTDINSETIKLATRVLDLFGYTRHEAFLLEEKYPYISCGSIDVFYCNGVLHHIPDPVAVMQRAWELLRWRRGGEARLMVYTDTAWRNYTGTEPPEDTVNHPKFMDFVRSFDQVGNYADWYNADKIERLFGQSFTLKRWQYLTPWNNYAAVILEPK